MHRFRCSLTFAKGLIMVLVPEISGQAMLTALMLLATVGILLADRVRRRMTVKAN